MTNPFDPRSILLAKHAQHVVLVHFPIALFLTGVLFEFAARWTNRNALASAAGFNIAAAAIAVVPTIISGLLAWQWQLEGQRLKGNLLLHLALGGLCGLLIALSALMRRRWHSQPAGTVPARLLAVELVTAIVITATAHIGGVLSGVVALD